MFGKTASLVRLMCKPREATISWPLLREHERAEATGSAAGDSGRAGGSSAATRASEFGGSSRTGAPPQARVRAGAPQASKLAACPRAKYRAS